MCQVPLSPPIYITRCKRYLLSTCEPRSCWRSPSPLFTRSSQQLSVLGQRRGRTPTGPRGTSSKLRRSETLSTASDLKSPPTRIIRLPLSLRAGAKTSANANRLYVRLQFVLSTRSFTRLHQINKEARKCVSNK